MKKIFYYLMCAVVAMGAMACQNDIDTDLTPNENGGEKVSFVAEIGEATRVNIDNEKVDGKYRITLDADDVLTVQLYNGGELGGNTYVFETTDGVNFSCEKDGVSELLTGEVYAYLGDIDSFCSFCGIDGINLSGTGNLSGETPKLTLGINSAVLTFESSMDVTFHSTAGIFSDMCGSDGFESDEQITITAEDGVRYMAIAGGVSTTFSYSIDDVECKSIDINFQPGKLYNLGTLTKINRVYLAPGEWKSDNAWFAAYFYKNAVESVAAVSATRAAVDANEVWVKMTDEDGNGTYECIVPEGFPNVVFCRMNSADTETMSFDNAWNQTVDIAIDTTADDFQENNSYYITSWGNDKDSSEGVWGLVPDAVVTPNETSTWNLASDWDGDSTTDWSDKNMVTTSTANLYVLKNVALEAYSEFKVRKGNSWDENYGGGHYYINANHYAQLYFDGHNVSVTESGNYDIYFHSIYKLLYIVSAGTDYDTATWQENEGKSPTAPSTPGEESEWALFGDWNKSGSWVDKAFITTETANIVVAEDVVLAAAQAFVVRKPSTEWADKYGTGNVNYIKANSFITTSKDGLDICVEAAGTYDIYFDVDSKKIYIMSADANYTTATEQTTNGKEPENEEPEVTADVLYLVPNANWKVDNARFAAYFFNNSGNVWVGMDDSDSDGIYEVNIPAGYKKGENVIFCRMNPSTTGNNWNNKWNQTADLTIPTDSKNLYTVKDGTWDKGGGEWSVK